jgi:hypothetical protein
MRSHLWKSKRDRYFNCVLIDKERSIELNLETPAARLGEPVGGSVR